MAEGKEKPAGGEAKDWEKKLEEKFKGWCSGEKKKKVVYQSSSGMVYCLGFIGAAIYYIQNATGFWNGVYGVLKALVWPAILVFKALEVLGL